MADINPIGRITLNGDVVPLTTSTYIGTNGNFWQWDANLQKYVDTGEKASLRGNQGPQGVGLKNTSPVVDSNGKLVFTLIDPSADGVESTITTDTSVQGVGIDNIVEVVDPTDTNYRKLQINLIDPKNGNITEKFTTNTIVPLPEWDDDILSIEVGGNTFTSPHLQGVGIKTTGTSTIDNTGRLVLSLINPMNGESSSVTSDKSVQGIGIGQITVDAQGRLVIPFIDPRTGTAPAFPTTVTTPNVVPTASWNDTNHTLTITVGGQNYTSGSLQGDIGNTGPQGYQGIYVSSGEVSPEGELTFHLTDPSGQTTPADIEVEGRFTGPQGTLITGIEVTDNYELKFTLVDPSTGDISTYTTSEAIQPTSVNTIEPVGNNVTITGNDIAVSATNSETISHKLDNMASVFVKSTSPTAEGVTPTEAEKLGLWVDRTTGISYVYDAQNTHWIALGAVWK